MRRILAQLQDSRRSHGNEVLPRGQPCAEDFGTTLESVVQSLDLLVLKPHGAAGCVIASASFASRDA